MADASTKVFHGASIAYITSGASAAAAAIVGATIANALTSTNLSSYARCDLILSGVSTSNTTVAASLNIIIYRRDLDVGGVAAVFATLSFSRRLAAPGPSGSETRTAAVDAGRQSFALK